MTPEENLGAEYMSRKLRAPRSRMAMLARTLRMRKIPGVKWVWSWNYRTYAILRGDNSQFINRAFESSKDNHLTVRHFGAKRLALGRTLVTITFWNAPR